VPWREEVAPVRMLRVALVAPATRLRSMLVEVADAGAAEVDQLDVDASTGPVGEASILLTQLHAEPPSRPGLAGVAVDVKALAAAGRLDLVAGEAELERRAGAAIVRGDVAAVAGWIPAPEAPNLADRLATVGAGVVPLRVPAGVDPPTMLKQGGQVRQSFSSLVRTYATVPYADVDPTLLAGAAYMLMFGAMFGDVGHGALLAGGALMLRGGRVRWLRSFRALWPFVLGAGLVAMLFGLLYGECFGPTGIVPVVWVAPLEDPVTLLGAALGMGAVLLGGAYVVGTINRWREHGWALAVSSPSGIAGMALFIGLGCVSLGAVADVTWVIVVGVVTAVTGVSLAYVGFLAAAGHGLAAVVEATVEVFDTVLRLGTNLASFARLAAFGLTHAALAGLVWEATRHLAEERGVLVVAAVVVLIVGNAVAFALEALVAGIQALRLEYYELFSRVFVGEGRAFEPWHVPLDRSTELPVAAVTDDITEGK